MPGSQKTALGAIGCFVMLVIMAFVLFLIRVFLRP